MMWRFPTAYTFDTKHNELWIVKQKKSFDKIELMFEEHLKCPVVDTCGCDQTFCTHLYSFHYHRERVCVMCDHLFQPHPYNKINRQKAPTLPDDVQLSSFDVREFTLECIDFRTIDIDNIKGEDLYKCHDYKGIKYWSHNNDAIIYSKDCDRLQVAVREVNMIEVILDMSPQCVSYQQ